MLEVVSLWQPKRLFDICLEYTAANIDDILKYDEQMDSSSPHLKFSGLPCSLSEIILDYGIDVCLYETVHKHNILNEKTKIINLKRSSPTIELECSSQFVGLQIFSILQDNCKNLVKINLAGILHGASRFSAATDEINILVGETFGCLVHLEWIDLSHCAINDKCVKYIGSNCRKLKYLNLKFTFVRGEGIRALCDPTMVPYGNCVELTHLYPGSLGGRGAGGISVSLVLLHCPDIEVLEYPEIDTAVIDVIAAIDGEFAASAFCTDDNRMSALCLQLSAISLNPEFQKSRLSQQRIFKLKHLGFKRNENAEFSSTFFEASGKYFPMLENFILKPSLERMNPGELSGIFGLPLLSVVYNEFVPRNLDPEVLRLFCSVGRSLTTLKLSYLTEFDLRGLNRECPNLTKLQLINCAIIDAHGAEAVDEHNTFAFNKLVKLNIDDSRISRNSYIALLSSPNLEIVWQDGNLELNTLLAALECPGTFCKLKELTLCNAEVSQPVLDAVLKKAVVLNEFILPSCYYFQDGQQVYYNSTIMLMSFDCV